MKQCISCVHAACHKLSIYIHDYPKYSSPNVSSKYARVIVVVALETYLGLFFYLECRLL